MILHLIAMKIKNSKIDEWCGQSLHHLKNLQIGALYAMYKTQANFYHTFQKLFRLSIACILYERIAQHFLN